MEKVSKKKGKEEKPDARGKFSGRIGYVLAVAGLSLIHISEPTRRS